MIDEYTSDALGFYFFLKASEVVNREIHATPKKREQALALAVDVYSCELDFPGITSFSGVNYLLFIFYKLMLTPEVANEKLGCKYFVCQANGSWNSLCLAVTSQH